MEGVGARLGRSSSRYSGPAVVFSGPVRKWKKKWVHVPTPNGTNNHHSSANGNSNATSHLLLYKWTPEPSPNGGGPSMDAANGAVAKDTDGPTRKRRFRYVPITLNEEHNPETTSTADDESKEGDADGTVLKDGSSTKAENDVAMQDANDSDKDGDGSEDASETHLDLNLGLKTEEGKQE